MYRTVSVMALVALCAELAHSFSWEIVTGVNNNRLEFFDINGILTHTENMTEEVYYISYDPVHNRVLFAEFFNIYSFDIGTKKIELLKYTANRPVTGLAYDPATELLFWAEGGRKINSMSLKPEFNNRKVNEKQFVLSEDYIHNIVADSCGGFIYGRATFYVQRTQFNGSDRELVFDKTHQANPYLSSLTIDQHSQKMYLSGKGGIKSADLNGKNVRVIDKSTQILDRRFYLAVSKEFIYWRSYNDANKKYNIWRLPKTSPRGIDVEPKLFIERDENISEIVANYNIEDITRENQNCDTLKSLLPNNSVSTDVSLLCVHGTKVSGASRCECAQGYSGERCDVSVCHNYCLHGDCSASAEGQPKCRCDPRYSGERCELNVCQGYCFRGDCSASADGQPKCRCNAGFSGEQCEVNACQGYCLNGGVCSLSEASKPLCRCTGHYEGERCEFPVFLIKCSKAVSILRDILNTDVTSDKGVKSSCASTAF